MLLGINNLGNLAEVERQEFVDPSPRKNYPGGTIYYTRPMLTGPGPLFLADFSFARSGGFHIGMAMRKALRAPEVILDMSWGFPIDLWAFALTVSSISVP